LAADGKPGFFRDVLYKGETFEKYSAWSEDSPPELVATPEMTYLTDVDSDLYSVLAYVEHSGTAEQIPWAIQADNRFFVVESPFDYIYEGDRYLVFADLLFDILDAPARRSAKYAAFRVEDVDPMESLSALDIVVPTMINAGITPHISLIPIYNDPYGNDYGDGEALTVSLNDHPEFLETIKNYQTAGATILWHGITHQSDDYINPYNGVSADDYEFYDTVNGAPLEGDSVSFVLDRLEYGYLTLREAGIYPDIWVTPHYLASALDNIVFCLLRFFLLWSRTISTRRTDQYDGGYPPRMAHARKLPEQPQRRAKFTLTCRSALSV
jgi:uncharacterized protein YdaL